MSRLVVTGGPLLSAPGEFHPRGAVAILEGRIVYAGPEAGLTPEPGDRILEAQGGLIMPGLINAHCHGAMTLFRGLADDLPLMTWLTEHMFPAEAKFVTPEMVELCTLLAAGEMLLSGVTTVADAYFHPHSMARAYRKAGMRAVVILGVLDFPAPGLPDPDRSPEAAREFVRAWKGRDPLISPALFAHSVYTCSPARLEGLAGLAGELGVPWQTHLAENQEEMDQVRQAYARTPVGHLEHLGLLSSLGAAVHCAKLAPGEAELLAARGVGIVSCPESNLKLASGLPHIADMLKAGCKVALGTDGAASNNDLSILGEMRTAALVAKGFSGDPQALPAVKALELATTGGAGVLGLGDNLGRLAPGSPADLLVLNPASPHLTPVYNWESHLTYAAKPSDVRHVVVGGELAVRDRAVLGFDLGEVMAKVRELGKKVAAAS